MTFVIDIPAYRQYLADRLAEVQYADGVALPVAPFAWSNPQPPLAIIQTNDPWITDHEGTSLVFHWRVSLFVNLMDEDGAHFDLDVLLGKVASHLLSEGYGLDSVSGYGAVSTGNQTMLSCDFVVSDYNEISTT